MKLASTLLLVGLVCPPSTHLQQRGPTCRLYTRSWKALYVPCRSLFFHGLLSLLTQDFWAQRVGRTRCIDYLSRCYASIPDKSTLKGTGFVLAHDPRVESIVAEKAWQQERARQLVTLYHSREIERHDTVV